MGLSFMGPTRETEPPLSEVTTSRMLGKAAVQATTKTHLGSGVTQFRDGVALRFVQGVEVAGQLLEVAVEGFDVE